MGKSFLAVFAAMVLVGVSLQGQSQIAVVPIGDDLFVIPACPLEPDNCEANPVCDGASVTDSGKARVIVTSDMAGADSVVGSDPDDIQSLVHLLTFSDRVDIEGLMGAPTREETTNGLTRQRFENVINAYSLDLNNLESISSDTFPNKEALLSTIADGSRAVHPINNSDSSYNNQAVQRIISQARCGWHNGDKRPLYLLGWGNATDIAQAIFQAPDIIPVVRVVTQSRGNNGTFAALDDCTPNGTITCDAWGKLRTFTNLWWVDSTVSGRILGECTQTIISDIKTGGNLGPQIVDNFNAPRKEPCDTPVSSTLQDKNVPWFKLGDTWTLMYTHNEASLRDDPLSNSSLKYGSYIQPDSNRTYWRLSGGEFKGRSTIYTDWQTRANNL